MRSPVCRPCSTACGRDRPDRTFDGSGAPGPNFDFDSSGDVLPFDSARRSSFENRMRGNFVDLRSIFNGRSGRSGVLDGLSGVLDERIQRLRSRAQIIGGLVNTFAWHGAVTCIHRGTRTCPCTSNTRRSERIPGIPGG